MFSCFLFYTFIGVYSVCASLLALVAEDCIVLFATKNPNAKQ